MFTTVLNKIIFKPIVRDTEFLENQKKFTNFIDDVPYLYIKHPNSDKLLIYSHGNSYDIYESKNKMKKISNDLKIDVIIYDYCGFGLGKKVEPTEENMCRDLDEIIKLSSELYPMKNIYLMGHSMGSGPSIKMARKYSLWKEGQERQSKIGGLIVFAGFASVFSVAFGTSTPFLTGLDLFNNALHIKYVNCPILVLHCTGDNTVSVSNAKVLINNAQTCIGEPNNSVFYYIKEGGDHNNLDPDLMNMILLFVKVANKSCE